MGGRGFCIVSKCKVYASGVGWSGMENRGDILNERVLCCDLDPVKLIAWQSRTRAQISKLAAPRTVKHAYVAVSSKPINVGRTSEKASRQDFRVDEWMSSREKGKQGVNKTKG